MAVEKITYKGKEVVILDYKGAKTNDDMLYNLKAHGDYLESQPGKMLILDDLSGTYISREFLAKAKALGKELESKRAKGAMLGIEGIKKILLKSYVVFTKANIKPFESREEALEYLVS